MDDLDTYIILYLNARAETHRPGATALEIFKAHSQCATVQHAYRVMDRLAKGGLVRCEAVRGRGIEFSLVDSVT